IVQPSNEWHQDYGPTSQPQTHVGLTYDNYGNLVAQQDDGLYPATGDERHHEYRYVPNYTAYIVGLRSEELLCTGTQCVTNGSGTTVLSHVAYGYDEQALYTAPAKGDVTKTRTWTDDFANTYVDS